MNEARYFTRGLGNTVIRVSPLGVRFHRDPSHWKCSITRTKKMLKVNFTMLGCASSKPRGLRDSHDRQEPVIVCHCHQVSDREIRRAISDGAHTIDAIGEICGAGSGCGGCVNEIASLLFRQRKVLPLVGSLMNGLERAS